MACITGTGSDLTLPTALAGPSATWLLKTSHTPATPGHMLGCAGLAFKWLLPSLSWSEVSHVEQGASPSYRLSNIPSSYGLSPVWTFLC